VAGNFAVKPHGVLKGEEEDVDAIQPSSERFRVNGGDLALKCTSRKQIENLGKDHAWCKESAYGLTHPREVLEG